MRAGGQTNTTKSAPSPTNHVALDVSPHFYEHWFSHVRMGNMFHKLTSILKWVAWDNDCLNLRTRKRQNSWWWGVDRKTKTSLRLEATCIWFAGGLIQAGFHFLTQHNVEPWLDMLLLSMMKAFTHTWIHVRPQQSVWWRNWTRNNTCEVAALQGLSVSTNGY